MKAGLNRRLIKPCRVGHKHDLEKRQTAYRAQMHNCVHSLAKLWRKRWFSVAAQRNLSRFQQI
jgi:hypothetical protein